MILMILWLTLLMGLNLPIVLSSHEAHHSQHSQRLFKGLKEGHHEPINTLKKAANNVENVAENDFTDSDGLNGNLEMYDYGEDFDCANETEGAENACDSGEYACYSGKCIPQLYVCNGINDCGDLSDEQGCGCNLDEFTCDNGDCIPISYKCNSFADCTDQSDEEEEMCKGCDDSEFTCNNGDCIGTASQCDGVNDCSDMSDELGCGRQCASDKFSCKNGNCISYAQKCNGENNCGDSSDEQGCTCKSDEFTCDNGNCISMDYYCDTADNCRDNSDEIGCECEAPAYMSCSDGRCIAASYECNNENDCGDWSDEEDCPCFSHEFACSNGACIDPEDVCDGNNDCGDWSDEQSCGNCDTDEITCNNGNCINQRYQCDGRDNCGDATDEEDCGGCTWTTWAGEGLCSEPCGVGSQTMKRNESPWGVAEASECASEETKQEECILSGCTAVAMDASVEELDAALLSIDEEIVYTMEYEFDNATDKVDACERFDRMFEARPSLLRTSSGVGESVYNGCESYTSDDGKSRKLMSRVDHEEGQKRKRKSGVNLQALTRMKRRASEYAYSRDRQEKSYKEYQNPSTMKGDETGIKGFTEDLTAGDGMKVDINRNARETNEQVPFIIKLGRDALLAREDALTKGPKKVVASD